MTVRCKFQLQEIRNHYYSDVAKTLVFQPSYDDKIPEDKRFYDATPSGRLEILVNNPVALEFFKFGNYYYFDATEVNG